ncbi:ubiquinone biosynthesis O-methyltransferase, mitochondrial [Phlebotomus papatasi]|uniref:ubiquinone biosynthesis O-methyltransferase, mitochondrial n=1 Tax=Phlebotomus papatasi TaxID=29031 RepID=UPI002483C0E2|nr:ubiquinone biosynthesis O-methyltransferase, mitochondrial [Phlebotomus papatasi]XP_055705436.1 ubiquinone biosynthesis O-methyltransferase, mitochondrial [Phlebotomus papatasi]
MLSHTQNVSHTVKQFLRRSSGKTQNILSKFEKISSITIGLPLRLCYATKASEESQKTAPSVDLENIEVMKKLAQTWWDLTGDLKPLHAMNHVRVPFIRDGLVATGKVKDPKGGRDILKGMDILEIGCGGGILTEALARLHANVTAIDPAEELIEVAKLNAEKSPEIQKRITYLTQTIEDHVLENVEKYDAVILSEVIEHVNDQENFIRHSINSLKSGGSIFLSTFNKTFLSYWLGIFVAENIIQAIPKGTHEWDKFISPQEMQRLFEQNNCSVIQTSGLMYQPWNNTWTWCESLGITYIQHAVKH